MNPRVDQYINNFDGEVRERLNQMRTLILDIVPNASEGFSYAMPAYKLNGKVLVYFAGYKNHVGFYATPTGHEKFARKLSAYKQGRGSVQFPNDKPLPIKLIEEIVLFRAGEVMKL